MYCLSLLFIVTNWEALYQFLCCQKCKFLENTDWKWKLPFGLWWGFHPDKPSGFSHMYIGNVTSYTRETSHSDFSELGKNADTGLPSLAPPNSSHSTTLPLLWEIWESRKPRVITRQLIRGIKCKSGISCLKSSWSRD